jgi:hypothetical protein
MKYPWVIGFGLLLPKPIPVYSMGGDFVPYPYPWGQFSSHTRTLIGEFPTGWWVSGPPLTSLLHSAPAAALSEPAYSMSHAVILASR